VSKEERLAEFIRKWARDAEQSIAYREKNGAPRFFIWPEFLAKSFKREAEHLLKEVDKNGNTNELESVQAHK
jgi:hypothetical protein